MAVFTPVAEAASSIISNGKLTAFSYQQSSKVGHLTVRLGHSTAVFRVPRHADCGVSMGQSGDTIPCRPPGSKKYAGKPVTVAWTHGAGGTRVASLVAVHRR